MGLGPEYEANVNRASGVLHDLIELAEPSAERDFAVARLQEAVFWADRAARVGGASEPPVLPPAAPPPVAPQTPVLPPPPAGWAYQGPPGGPYTLVPAGDGVAARPAPAARKPTPAPPDAVGGDMAPREVAQAKERLRRQALLQRAAKETPAFYNVLPTDVCRGCEGDMASHPFDHNHLDEFNRVYLRRICDGSHVRDGTYPQAS